MEYITTDQIQDTIKLLTHFHELYRGLTSCQDMFCDLNSRFFRVKQI